MVRTAALLLTVTTGFSGLVYEISWEKLLATLLGSHSEATAAVLGIFLGGLAVGYGSFGALSQRILARSGPRAGPRRLLLLYGALEAGIGAHALLLPVLFAGARAVSWRLPAEPAALSFGLDIGLAALLVGPPAVAMGATIPVLTQALSRSVTDASRLHALVYAFNTLGAFAGALAAGFWLLPELGIVNTLRAVACLNLFAGASFAALARHTPRADDAPAHASSAGPAPELARAAAIALLCGFAMMAIQTVTIRLGALSFGSSHLTFSLVVAVFVLCIALGSFAVAGLRRIHPRLLPATLWALCLLLGLLYTQLDDAPYAVHVLRSRFSLDPSDFARFHAAAFLAVAGAIGLPVALSGAALPLLFHSLRREAAALGADAGRLYRWNTLGSLAGALLGGYALLHWLDLDDVFRLALLALVVAAALAVSLEMSRGVAAAGLAAGLAGVLALPAWSPERLTAGLFRERAALTHTYDGPDTFFARHPRGAIRFHTDDPVASITVKEFRGPSGATDLAIVTNGKSDSGLDHDRPTTGLLGLLPALFAERAERAFVIGYGTGVTAGELAALDEVREVWVAEIARGVIAAAPLFDPGNGDVSHNPKVHIDTGDAYRTLMRSRSSFDVIVSEPSNPWVTGVEMLYSRELLEAARDHLEPGGVHAQWIHLYETDPATVALVLRTYTAVFDHVAVWYGLGSDLILLGMREDRSGRDLERLVARAGRADFAAGLRRSGVAGLPELLAHEVLPFGVASALKLPGVPHTLLHPRLSHLAARAFFTGGLGSLPISSTTEGARAGARASLAGRWLADRRGDDEAARARFVAETCRHRATACATLVARFQRDHPESARFREMTERLRARGAGSAQTKLDTMAALAGLFGDEPIALPGADPVALAMDVTNLYARHYHHGAPFRRAQLAALWDRCESDPERAGDCRAKRAVAERRLGSLRAESPTVANAGLAAR